jgi:hypothetical protein
MQVKKLDSELLCPPLNTAALSTWHRSTDGGDPESQWTVESKPMPGVTNHKGTLTVSQCSGNCMEHQF